MIESHRRLRGRRRRGRSHCGRYLAGIDLERCLIERFVGTGSIGGVTRQLEQTEDALITSDATRRGEYSLIHVTDTPVLS